jgi:hypothetical protein
MSGGVAKFETYDCICIECQIREGLEGLEEYGTCSFFLLNLCI